MQANPDVFGLNAIVAEPAAQQANLAQAISQQQYKNLADLNNAKLQAGAYRNLGSIYGGAPQLQTNVEANTIPEGVLKGLATGLGNFTNFRQYGQRQQAYRDLAGLQQQQQQNQIDLAERQLKAQGQRDLAAFNYLRGLGTASPGVNSPKFTDLSVSDSPLATLYSISDRTGRDKILTDLATGNVSNYLAPFEGTAKGQSTVNEKSTILGHTIKSGYGPNALEVKGVPIPGRLNSFRFLTGQEPTTSLDVEKDLLSNQQLSNTVAAQPTQLTQEAVGRELDNNMKMVTAKYADAKAQIDVLLGQGKVDEANQLKSHLDAGKQRYDQAVSAYDRLTPGQVKLFNSQMKSLKLPYELPEKQELKASTKKGKVVEFYNPETGEIIPAKR
jgi:hypothetical protein